MFAPFSERLRATSSAVRPKYLGTEDIKDGLDCIIDACAQFDVRFDYLNTFDVLRVRRIGLQSRIVRAKSGKDYMCV